MDHTFPIMFARGGSGFLIYLGLLWCFVMLILWVVRVIAHPKMEWNKLTPNTRDTILGWILVGVVFGVIFLLSK